MEASTQPSAERRGLTEAVAMALTDSDFRRRILEQPEIVASKLGLSEGDAATLRSLDSTVIEQAATKFAEGTSSSIRIMIGIHRTLFKPLINC